jgi:hypothetical protein
MTYQDPHSLPPERPYGVNDPRRFPDPNLPPDARFEEAGRRSYGGTWGVIAGLVAAILVVSFIWAYTDDHDTQTANLPAPPTASRPVGSTPSVIPPNSGVNDQRPATAPETTGQGESRQ